MGQGHHHCSINAHTVPFVVPPLYRASVNLGPSYLRLELQLKRTTLEQNSALRSEATSEPHMEEFILS